MLSRGLERKACSNSDLNSILHRMTNMWGPRFILMCCWSIFLTSKDWERWIWSNPAINFLKTKSPLQCYLADISLTKIWSGNHLNREYSKQPPSSRTENEASKPCFLTMMIPDFYFLNTCHHFKASTVSTNSRFSYCFQECRKFFIKRKQNTAAQSTNKKTLSILIYKMKYPVFTALPWV